MSYFNLYTNNYHPIEYVQNNQFIYNPNILPVLQKK